MKTVSAMGSSLALAALLCNPLAASAAPAEASPWVASAFGASDIALKGATRLSAHELETSTGRFGPLGFAFMVAGFDLTLIGVYWGVYVPHYGGGGGACVVCNNGKFNAH